MPGPWGDPGPDRYRTPVTWLWALLIVVGIAMIVVALWPSIRGGKADKPADDQKPEGI
jgi:hypothetical protein